MISLYPKSFSDQYEIKHMTQEDVEEIYEFCLTNPQYYDFCGSELTKESIIKDLSITPPNITLEDKYYVGFFKNDVLTAVLDLISGYPEERICFIGFFMISGRKANSGMGTAIIENLCDYLKSCGFTSVQLAYEISNPQASHFWIKNGFSMIREVKNESGHLIVGEKVLS